ncbi:DUF4935 domain-containing protein [Patescibacteria group bacterium]|nr:DUF4935 domain-containing protein [Patescibacteria group bacterium]
MEKNKYKIVFDANNLFCKEENNLKKVFNSNIKEIFNFLKLNKVISVSLCVPQLVFDERISQRLKQIRTQHENFNKALVNLKVFESVKTKEKKFKKEKYQKILNEDALGVIKKYKVKIISTAKIEQEVVTERALKKVAPFYGGEGDNGFKDTLMWLSLLKDAKKNKKHNYILLTDDRTGFKQKICEEEFKEYSSADFLIIRNLADLKKFLDEKLNLDLELKKLYQGVEQNVLAMGGTITVKVGNYLNTKTDSLTWPLQSSLSVYGDVESKKENGNFDFHSLEIENISQINENEFDISANLKVITKELNNESCPWHRDYVVMSFNYRDDRKIVKYNINFKYNKNFNIIELLSATKNMHYTPYQYYEDIIKD